MRLVRITRTFLLCSSLVAPLGCGKKASNSHDAAATNALVGTWQRTCWYVGDRVSGNLGGQYRRATYEFTADLNMTFVGREFSDPSCTDQSLNEVVRYTGTYSLSSSLLDLELKAGFVTVHLTTGPHATYWEQRCPELDFPAGKEIDASSCTEEVGVRLRKFFNSVEVKEGKTLCFGDDTDFSGSPLPGGLSNDDRFAVKNCDEVFTKD